MSTRACKGYLVTCRNPAVKGRLFCFTCAGRKSRNKKTQALESFERECESLRKRLSEIEPQLVCIFVLFLYLNSMGLLLRVVERGFVVCCYRSI